VRRLRIFSLLMLAITFLLPAAGRAAEAVASATATPAADGIPIGPHVFGALRARNLGPAVMSGRITCLDAVATDPRFIWVGCAGGGIWKSRDGGVTFDAVFDEFTQSIGALAIDQARPDTVWAGTGESWVRNSVGVGDGVYRTVNGGDKWVNLGLKGSERIAEILIHPADPATVFVAAMGPLWGPGSERGVFRTRDGGATWEKTLYVDDTTGCVDIAFDPADPSVMYAAMWQFRRTPSFFTSGGPGSGLFKSTDGGATWRKLDKGLPKGDLGRIAIAVMPSQPATLFAAVEAERSGFYRSDDRGETWRLTTDARAVGGRPFYFALLIPDPVDAKRVYKAGTNLMVTRDAGVTFDGVGGWVHSDIHALWVQPSNPKFMIVGTDGGVYISTNQGSGWRHVSNLPVSQFYHVTVDDQRPFHVYGGLQDNGSWTAPSRSSGGIDNSDWANLGGGDGFSVVPDRADPQLVYWEWQGGNVQRLDRRTGDSKDIKPQPGPGDPDFRFNWNTPIVTSPGDGKRLYVGSQFLHRSTDRGDTWRRISGDLTTSDPARLKQEQSGGLTVDNTTAENHCTIFTISESPRDRRVIWVGTDDGNLQVTADEGARWTNVAANLPNLPKDTWISCVEASSHDRRSAFVTADGHRAGDMATYVFATDDLGSTWRALATPDVAGQAHVIRQDPANADLLYLGTENGLYMSLDRGRHWARFAEKFPAVPVYDLVVQQREGSLVIATHGRGIWVIDDLSPLRNLTAAVLAAPVSLLPSRPAVLSIPRGEQQFPGDSWYAAGNPETDARIVYYLAKRHMVGPIKIEILAADGSVLKTLPAGTRKGLNMVTWSPTLKPPKVAPSPVMDPSIAFAAAVGPAAPEGSYRYRLVKGEEVFEGTVGVAYDPDYPHPPVARAAQQKAVRVLYDMLARMAYVCDAVKETRVAVEARAGDAKVDAALKADLLALAGDLKTLQGRVMVEEEVQGISGRKALREKVISLYAGVAGFGGPPTKTQMDRQAGLTAELDRANGEFTALTGGRLAALNARVQAAGLEAVKVLTAAEHAARE
jgi:photosystem II stability/assembly factor-like uncharacterized protein